MSLWHAINNEIKRAKVKLLHAFKVIFRGDLMKPLPEENQIRPLVEQLYEIEGLTDALTDEAATMLLTWGEKQLKNLAQLHLAQTDIENAAHALQQAIRAVNRLIEQRADLSDTEMVEHLLKLIDQVITITLITQQSTNPGGVDDQKIAEQRPKNIT